jgi:formylglycine-generating enzyme required for sulfatase activity
MNRSRYLAALLFCGLALSGWGGPGSSPAQDRPDLRTWRDAVTGMEFVWVPGGTFRMGCDGEFENEHPVHQVTVDGFWMGRCEVTVGEWAAIMGEYPSFFGKSVRHPVERVSFDDAQEFIRRLRDKTGETFRLPTEAEWEYACRAGSTEDQPGNLDEIAWYARTSHDMTHPVGEKKPNAFGLCDMLGNVWEWVADWYGPYPAGPVKNPKGPASGTERINRGGGWFLLEMVLRPAHRRPDKPSGRYSDLGFRLARTG